ncbi:MAG: hypothetical protein IT428_06900 [Planctomycetaceae bacterium]|nr:hypothetical protein [Planctomycetaceae bacterium]
MTRADIRIHRPWIPQKLAVLLLEENNRYQYGSNRLLEGTGGMAVVHCHVCDTRLFTSRDVIIVGRILIQQMEHLVARLYAEDLVIHTPEGDRVLDLG